MSESLIDSLSRNAPGILVAIVVIGMMVLRRRPIGGKRAPPCLGSHPVLGILIQLSPERVFSFLNLNLGLGDFEAFACGERFLFLSDFDAIKEVLQKRPKTFRRTVNFEKFAIEYRVTHGLFNDEGDVWGRVRRLVSPSFSAKHLISMFSVITNQAKILLDGFAAHANSGSALDVFPLFNDYASRTMYGLIFGDIAKQIDYMKSNQLDKLCTDPKYNTRRATSKKASLSLNSLIKYVSPVSQYL
jgi:cytochrome P450